MLILSLYKVSAVKDVYGKDLVVYDTKPIKKLEPQFLKKLDVETELPEPEPMYESEDDEITGCGGWSDRIIFNTDEFSKTDLLKKVEKNIDSIKFNNLERRVHINIILNKQTSYQTFIDILDLFDKKNSRLFGLHKETIFWIE